MIQFGVKVMEDIDNRKVNRGFSFIELIVVISIIALLISGTGISLRILAYTDTEKITKEIDQSLRKLRLDTMSQGNLYHYMFLTWEEINQEYQIGYVTGDHPLDEFNWNVEGEISGRKKLASSKVKILVGEQTDGSDGMELGDTTQVILIQFYVHSGAYQSPYRTIMVEHGRNRTTIHMVGKTGKHYIS